MSKNIAIGIVIGAVLSGSVASAFGSARRMTDALGNEVERARRKQVELGQMIQSSMGKMAPQALALAMAQYHRLGDAVDKVRERQERLKTSMAAHEAAGQYRSGLVGQMRQTATQGAAIAAPLVGAVRVFMDQEAAATNMKVAYMQAGGKVPKEFEEIKKQTIELGDVLPGTTADFMNLGRVLKEQGLQADVIAGGALKAAAYMNVVLETPQEFGGEFIAKMMEARGIDDKDLLKAADLAQRARFGFGMKPAEMLDSMKYDAATANILGIKGLENTEKLLAVQGMGAQVGLEGASFGTNFSMFLQRMGKGPKMLAEAKKGMKAEARAIVEDLGITFEFFDKQGNFKGIDAMVAELEKLEQIKSSKYGQDGALLVASEMFGAEAGRPAMIIAEKGVEGYQKNIQIMREQADLQTRLKEKSATLANAWESLTGTASNLAATVGSVFGEELRQAFVSINNFIGGPLSKWVQANKEHILLGVKIVGGFLAMKMAILGGAWALSFFVGGPLRAAATGMSLLSGGKDLIGLMRLQGVGRGAMLLRMFGVSAERADKTMRAFGWIGGWLSRMGAAAVTTGRALAGPLFMGLRSVGIALLGIPGIGWITAALLVLGALVWKYWGPIKGFVKGLWDGLKSGLSAAAAAVRPGMQSLGKVLSGLWGGLKGAASAVWAALKPLGGVIVAAFAPFQPVLAPVIGLVRRAWTWFTELITPIRAAGPNSQAMGKAVGEALGKIIAKGAELLGYFAGLPGKFLKFGGDIVTGLLEGLQSKWELLKSKVGAMADMVSGVFQQKQKIHSPSRVFMGFGRNIGEGAALGIDQSISGVRAAIGAMSAAITLAFAPAPLLAQPVLSPMHTAQPAASHQVPPLVPRMAPMATPQVPDATAAVRGQWALPQIPQQALQLLPALARLPVIGPMLQPLLPRMASMATPQVPDATAAVRGQWALPQIPQQALQLLPALARLPVIGPMLQPLLPRMAPMATPQVPDATAAVRGQWALPQIPQQALQLLPALARLPVIGPMLQPLLPRMASMATPQVPDATAAVRGQWTLPQIPQQALQLPAALAAAPQPPSRLEQLLRSAHAVASTPTAPGQAAAGNITVHYAPSITIQDQGNAQATGTAVQTALITNQRDLERMLQRILEERERRSIR